MKQVVVSISGLFRQIDGQPSRAFVKFEVWQGNKMLVKDTFSGKCESLQKNYPVDCADGDISVEHETSASYLTISAKLETEPRGRLDEYQLLAVEKRRNEIISLIVETLSPRRTELYWERRLDMHAIGRCVGLFQSVAELQALLEINERGLEAREQILKEFNRPPFKHFPLPEGWGAPCVDYIRGVLFNNAEGYPNLQWPLKGGSTAGVEHK